MSSDLLVGKNKDKNINHPFKGVTWGALEEENTEFENIEKSKVSKADCAFTFEFNKDGTYLRTQTLYKLFEHTGKWKLENSILNLKDDEGEGEFEYNIDSIVENEKIILKN
eukprot:gene1528-12654_t